MTQPTPALDKRNHIFAVIATTVLALGLVRAVMLVAHAPPLGYGAPSPWVGALSIALIGAVAVVTALALRPHPVASIVHALLFFLVVADPVSTLWLNSLQPERSALIGVYAIAAMVPIIALERAKRLHWIVLIAAIVVLLGMAPPSFALLPIVLAAALSPLLVRRSRRDMGWVAVAAIAAALIAFVFPQQRVQLAPANASLVPTMAAAQDARGSLRAIARVLPAASSLAPASLDVSSQGRVHRLADLPPSIMSFAGLVSAVPATASTFIAMLMILTIPFAVFWLAWAARHGPAEWTAIPALYVVLVTVSAYCVVATALGFCGADIARGQSVGVLTMLAALLLTPLVIWNLTRDPWAGRVGLVVIFGIVLMAGAWFAWSRTAPIAIGTVERITPGANRTLEVSGWAIDPRGVKRVYATVGGGAETTATLGTERRDLQAAYPGYPDVITGGFQMTIASNAWRENQALRVYVENRTGAITEIDRRDVRLAP